MAKQVKTAGGSKNYKPLFYKENYRLMLIGLGLVLLGLLLMIGGKSKDPNIFDPSEVYSFRRITVAPILILGGLAVEIVGIFKKPKAQAPK
ncbi:MAG TPA: DUF3098 domain-containing protein [Puia sp.]|jgi:hypothetical protein|nr:DUF3098 domain-containing protein [Puia sp.]